MCLVVFVWLLLLDLVTGCFDVSFFYFIILNFAPDKCRKCVLSCFVITFHVPILAAAAAAFCWIFFCVTQCSWISFFFDFWGLDNFCSQTNGKRKRV